MDPFAEKDMIECLRNIANTLKSMDSKLEDISNSIREIGAEVEIAEAEEGEEDLEVN